MLGKLFKYEFDRTWKVMVIIFAIASGIAIINCINISGVFADSLSVDEAGGILIFSVVLFSVFAMTVFASIFVGYIYSCWSFYKSMYSEQGYLTHTLPVDPAATIFVKLIVAFVWFMGNVLVVAISILAFACSGANMTPAEALARISEEWQKLVVTIDENAMEMIGHGAEYVITIVVLMALFSILRSYMFVFTSFTIGQLSNNHKVGSAVLAGFGLSIINRVVSATITVNRFNILTDFSDMINSTMWISLVYTVVSLIVMYVVNVYLVKHKLNLQ